MTYEPRLITCPYMSRERKCTHKHIVLKKTKKKRYCGYGDPNECDMYCEWLEERKSSENALKPLKDGIEPEDDIKE